MPRWEASVANFQERVVLPVCASGKIVDATLKDAVARAEMGAIDADLGGGVIKQQLARPGQGKSGGYRSIILFRNGERAFFVYGFAKSERENIAPDEQVVFKKSARSLFALSEMEIEALLDEEVLTEINDED
jgi:hypothetical protein